MPTMQDQMRRDPEAETLLDGERRLLEMVASGSPLPAILAGLCSTVEASAAGCHCSVLLVDPGAATLRHGAAPTLPTRLCEAIHGRPVVPYWGPCAMAIDQKMPVVVSDVVGDARWGSFGWGELALGCGLRSCWTTPIFSSTGEVLGTFAIYRCEPGSPTPLQRSLIESFTYIASLAIERAQNEAFLRQSEAFLAKALGKAPPDLGVLRERQASLGRREREVMDLVVSGLLNKQIGARLGIREVTVKAHRGQVMRKMQAASLADLVRMAARLSSTYTFV